MPYPSVDRAVNLSSLRRVATKERNLSGIIIFIRICDSSRVGDIYFVAPVAMTLRVSGIDASHLFSLLLMTPRGIERKRKSLLNVGSFNDVTSRRE